MQAATPPATDRPTIIWLLFFLRFFFFFFFVRGASSSSSTSAGFGGSHGLLRNRGRRLRPRLLRGQRRGDGRLLAARTANAFAGDLVGDLQQCGTGGAADSHRHSQLPSGRDSDGIRCRRFHDDRRRPSGQANTIGTAKNRRLPRRINPAEQAVFRGLAPVHQGAKVRRPGVFPSAEIIHVVPHSFGGRSKEHPQSRRDVKVLGISVAIPRARFQNLVPDGVRLQRIAASVLLEQNECGTTWIISAEENLGTGPSRPDGPEPAHGAHSLFRGLAPLSKGAGSVPRSFPSAERKRSGNGSIAP